MLSIQFNLCFSGQGRTKYICLVSGCVGVYIQYVVFLVVFSCFILFLLPPGNNCLDVEALMSS